MAWSPDSDEEIKKTIAAYQKPPSLAPGAVRKESENVLNACIERLRALEDDNQYNKAWSQSEKDAEKKEIYALMRRIREANSGVIERTWFEAMGAVLKSVLLPKNILKNVLLFTACAFAAGIFGATIGPAIGGLGLGAAGGALAGVFGAAALTGPLGLGALVGVAIAAAVLFVGCKLLQAGFQALKSFKNWLFGTTKEERAKSAAQEVRSEHAQMVRKHPHLAPLSGSPHQTQINVSVGGPSTSSANSQNSTPSHLGAPKK